MAEPKAVKKSSKNFFMETKMELKKASWPTKGQLLHNTGVILVFIAIVAIILSILDLGFSQLIQFITTWL